MDLADRLGGLLHAVVRAHDFLEAWWGSQVDVRAPIGDHAVGALGDAGRAVRPDDRVERHAAGPASSPAGPSGWANPGSRVSMLVGNRRNRRESNASGLSLTS